MEDLSWEKFQTLTAHILFVPNKTSCLQYPVTVTSTRGSRQCCEESASGRRVFLRPGPGLQVSCCWGTRDLILSGIGGGAGVLMQRCSVCSGYVGGSGSVGGTERRQVCQSPL